MAPPLIPDTPPGVAPVVELGVGDRYDASATAALWDSARWSTPGDENEWGGTEPLWHDITCELIDAKTFTGRDGALEPFGIGTATLVVRNVDGWADYKPPGAHDNVLSVRPGRQLRVGVKVGAAPTAWLWRGTTDTTEPGYAPGEGDVVTFGCVDAKGDAGRAKLPKTLEPVGYGETGSQRMTRTLNNVAWPAWRRALEADNVQLSATEFGSQVADELDRTAESCSGHVYGDLAGRVAFRRKDWMTWTGSTPVDGTIGNGGGAGEVCPSGWEIRYGRDDITSVALVGRPGETPLVMVDAETFGVHGFEPWERSDLMPLDDFELSRIGSRVLNVRSPEHMPRVAAVTLNASTGDGEVAELLAAASPFKPSRFRCRHYSNGRLVFDRTMMVCGITHTLSPRDGWTARLTLDDAMPHRNVDNPARWSDPASRWSDDDQWATST